MTLFVSGEYPPDVGGVGDYTHRLRVALAERGSPSTLLSRRQVGRWDARALAALLRATSSERSDTVHIQFQAGAFDLLGDVCLMPALLRRLRPHVRVLTTFHDTRVPYLFPRAGRLRPAAIRLMARHSHAVIAADERDLLSLGGPSPRHVLIPIGSNVSCAAPPGFDRVSFRTTLGLSPDHLTVVYFGMLNASKGVEVLLDAFDLVAQAEPRARLLLLGGEVGASDPSDRLTATGLHTRLNSLGARLLRPGWLPPADLSAHLLSADVAVLPYRDGASPRRGSLLACAEHGLPIVTTQPASPQVADGIFAVPLAPTALAQAIQDVARDCALANRLRAASRALAHAMSWPRIAEQHLRIYEQVR